MANFNVPIPSGLWVIQKMAFVNLCKPYHDVNFHFEYENFGGKEEKYNFLVEMENIFYNC